MRWLFVLVALAACDRVFELGDIHNPPDAPDAPVMSPDARSGYSAAVLADEPLAYWRLGVASGLSAVDETGRGNVGMLLGGVVPDASGALAADDDGAMTFDGMNDTITMGDRFSFEGTASFTIEAWVQPRVHTNYAGVLSKTDEANGGNDKIGWHMFDSYQAFGCARYDGTGDQDVRTTAPLPLDVWSYAAVTFDGSILTLYIDGAVQASSPAPVSIPPTSGAFAIGARHGGQWLFFGGLIDEVAVYDHVLGAQQINHHRAVALGL